MEIATRAPSSIAFRPQPYAYLLTETDHADIATLQQAGISRPQATVLLVLHKYSAGIKVTSRWIERVSDLRQPEVSIAISELAEVGMVGTTEDKNLSKGRPVKVYHVLGDIPGYVRSRVAARVAEINKAAASVNKVFDQGVPA